MKNKENLYEPVIDFRKQRRQMQIKNVKQEELYEKAFLVEDDHGASEYAFNTTTWD